MMTDGLYNDYEEMLDRIAALLVGGGDVMPADIPGGGFGMIWYADGDRCENFVIKHSAAIKTGLRKYGYTMDGIAEARRRASEIRDSRLNFWGRIEAF